jgi:hypothetical protein
VHNASFVVGRDSERNPLHLTKGNLIGAPVVEPGGPRRFVVGHLLGDLQLAAVVMICHHRAVLAEFYRDSP